MSDPVASRLRAVPDAPPPVGPCPDDGDLMGLRDGRLTGEHIARLDRHLAACAECRALLRDLSEPVPAALLEALVELAPEPRRRRLWPIAVSAAIAAAVVLMLLPSGGQRPVPAYDLHGPFGGAQLTRTVNVSHVFTPRSRFKVLLRPNADLTGQAPVLRAFVASPDGVLSAIPPSAISGGVGGAWRVEALASDLFHAPGAYTVHLALATDPDALDHQVGSGAQAARRATPFARWLTIDVEFRDD